MSMKIFGLINKNSGPGFHRIVMPLLLMPDVDCYITNAVEEKDFEERKPDAIYYNRIISDEVLRLQSKYHFRVIVDVDDYWNLDPHHIMFKYSKLNNIPAHAIKHLQIADVVTTTHDRLAEMIYPYNKNVVVCPNAIPTHEYFPVNKTEASKNLKRIFWQGSITHEADLKLLGKTIKKLDYNKFMMVLCGYTQAVEWERMADNFTDRLRLRGVVLPGLPPHEYYNNYQYADICLVPLLSTKFNMYKSNLKILEAAHSGCPVIASNVHPYKDIPGVMYVNKESDWHDLIHDFDQQNESAKILQQYCRDNFNFDKINLKRKQVFL